MLETKKN